MAISSDVVFWIDHDSGSDTARTALTSCVASNPSGTITRINKTAHGLDTGAVVDLSSFSAWLNAAFRITKVDADNFDLDDTVWQTTDDADGTVTPRGGNISSPWKTITSGATAGRLSNLTDVNFDVRHKKTAAPVSLSQNATLTNGSRTGTLTTALTLTLDNCETAWTAATNVTATTSTTRKEGSNACQLAANSSFTTGAMGYKDLGSNTNLSAYTGITFQLRCNTVAIAANALQIRMYSDAGRTTLVETLQVPAVTISSKYCPITILKGSALSSSVRVIELYANTTQANRTYTIDNVSACTTALHLRHMIGINDGLWMTMDWIDGTSFGISNEEGSGLPTAGYGWPKDTTTATLYARLPYIPADGGVSTQGGSINTINVGGGDDTHRAKFSFGWNLSNQTQDGETWFDGLLGYGYGITAASSVKYIDVSRICVARCNLLGYANASVQDMYFYDCKCTAAGNGMASLFSSALSGNYKFLFDGCVTFAGQYGIKIDTSNYDIEITDCEFYGQTSYGIYVNQSSSVTIKGCTIRGKAGYGISALATVDLNIIGCTIKDCARATLVGTSAKAVYLDCDFSNCTEKHYLNFSGRQWMVNCSYDNLTSFMVPLTANDGNAGTIYSHNTDDVANDHRVYSTKGTVIADATAHDGTAAFRWKMMPLQAYPVLSSKFPLMLELHKCVCVANVAQTIKCNAWRDSTDLSIGIRVRDANLTGITADIDALCTASANTKQELTLTFTPTQSGVISIWGVAWGGTTYSGWLADLTPMANQSTKALTTAFGGQPFSSNSGEAGGGSTPQTIGFASFGG